MPEDKRIVLQRLREQIHAAAPDATEAISYGMPAFKLGRRYFVGFSATKDHCSFYAGRAPLDAFASELADYRLWKGTINYAPDQGLPADLVTKLVQTRLDEYRER